MTRMEKFLRSFLIIISVLFFTIACTQLEIVPRKSDPVMEGRIADDLPLTGLGDDKKTLRELVLGSGQDTIDYTGSITFQTALDKISFMPLSSVDSMSGVIVTDWYNVEDNDIRIKLNVRILDQNMTDGSLSVQMFKQSFDGQKWNDLGNDETQAQKIKDSILRDARLLQATIDLS